jgi:hypothetical protein
MNGARARRRWYETPLCTVVGILSATAGLAAFWSWFMMFPLQGDEASLLAIPIPRPFVWLLCMGASCLLLATMARFSEPLPDASLWHRAQANSRPLLSFAVLPLAWACIGLGWVPDIAANAVLEWGIPLLFLVCLWQMAVNVLPFGELRLPSRMTFGKIWLIFFVAVHIFGGAFARPFSSRFGRHQYLGGDEPRYLLLTHSLAKDRNFNLYQNWKRRHRDRYICPTPNVPIPSNEQCAQLAVAQGAGGRHGDPEYWEGRRYGKERPGMPLLLAPAYKLGLEAWGRHRYGVVAMLNAVLAFTMANIMLLTLALTRNSEAAWLSGLVGGLSGPLMFYGVAAYPDPVAAALIVFAIRKIFELFLLGETRGNQGRRDHFALMLALAYMPWVHEKTIIFAGMLTLAYCGLVRPPLKIWYGIILPMGALSLGLQAAYYWQLYGRIIPPYVHAEPFRPGFFFQQGIWGLWLDKDRGVVPIAPWVIVGGFGLIGWWKKTPLAFSALMLSLVIFVLSTAAFSGWYGGACSPGRYMTNVMPLFAVGLGLAWHRMRCRLGKALVLTLCLIGMIQGAGGVLAHRLVQLYRIAVFRELFPNVFQWTTAGITVAAGWGAVVLGSAMVWRGSMLRRAGYVVAGSGLLAVLCCTAWFSASKPIPRLAFGGKSLVAQQRAAGFVPGYPDEISRTFNAVIEQRLWLDRLSFGFVPDDPVTVRIERERGRQPEGVTVMSDAAASGGAYTRWVGSAASGTMIAAGPFASLHQGHYLARYRLRLATEGPSLESISVGSVDLAVRHDDRMQIEFARLTLSMTELGGEWVFVDVPFTMHEPLHLLNFSIEAQGDVAIDMDCVHLVWLGPPR